MLMMGVEKHHDSLQCEGYLMNCVVRYDEDCECTELFQLPHDEILNYYNHRVVSFDNNLMQKIKKC